MHTVLKFVSENAGGSENNSCKLETFGNYYKIEEYHINRSHVNC